MRQKILFLSFVLIFATLGSWLLFLTRAATPTTWYAAPTGNASGDGSITKPWDLQTAFNKTSVIKPGDTLFLRGGKYTGVFTSNLNGASGAPITVRSNPSEWAALDGAAIYGTVLTINGSYTNYRDFEVFKSDPARVSSQSGSSPSDISRGISNGINDYGPNTKLINLVVHDAGNGIGVWSQAANAEVTGSISYNNGWWAPDRGHGHALYTQNQTGTKLFKDNIFINSFDIGIQAYGSDQAFLIGLTFDGNVAFGNEWLVGGGTPASRVTLLNNMLYNVGLKLGYSNGQNQDVTLQNNYVYSTIPVDAKWWQQINASNNTFVGKDSTSGANITMFMRSDGSSVNSFTGNTWVRGRSGGLNNYSVRAADGVTTSSYTFTQWQQLGYDTNGTEISNSNINATTRLTGVKSFVRPNAYEAGRALIAVFNWNLGSSVTIDVSGTGLQKGQKYSVLNVANYLGSPVASGTYNGGSITIPMNSLAPANYIGNSPSQPANTGPEFGSFILIPGSPPAAAPPPPTSGGGSNQGSTGSPGNSLAPGTPPNTNSGTSAPGGVMDANQEAAAFQAEAQAIQKTQERKTIQKKRQYLWVGIVVSGALALGSGLWFTRRRWSPLVAKLAHLGNPKSVPDTPSDTIIYHPDKPPKP